MELLYVWINSNDTGYIKQEGFNFSPEYRFIMEYSKESWILKEDNSFLKKISIFKTSVIENVTAIIGENGVSLDMQPEKYQDFLKLISEGFENGKHNDVVQEIIRKNQLNSTTYIHSLYEENKNIFESESEVENMVYSNYLGDDEVGLRSLGKLTRDIVEELKLYEKLKGR